MKKIRVIYTEKPSFPATDQHPDAVRYKCGAYWVDAIGGEPTMNEIAEVLNPPSQPTLEDRLAAVESKLKKP